MRRLRLIAPLFVVVLFIAMTLGCGHHGSPDPLPGMPRLVLWAWERPEHLEYIVPSATGVAYLAGTVSLARSEVQAQPRLQPLFVPDRTPVIAVIRIETDSGRLAPVSEVSKAIAGLAARTGLRAVQIDFDARRSQRQYYRDLITQLRREIPDKLPLEMTALVSWCRDDNWINGLEVAEAVPMFFRMGMDPHATTEHLREPLCLSSFGISTDEFYVTVPHVRRVFVFSSQRWTETSYRAVLEASKQWFAN
ncbi:MAG: DUF3142 domain-containing protein [Acidobacteriaceae bacterium]|nr:DUF3142 domain-containing protein [Acidobacteriaceae bacterium]